MNTPMHPTCTLSREDTGSKVDHKLYKGMIGSLLYLTASRPYILFSVCLCARFQSDPRESHLTAVKRIFKYLKGTTNLGLLYRKFLDYKLVGFYRIERKSTSENCQFLGENHLSWASKRQATIVLSTTEQNTFKLQVVVHNYSGWNISSKIIRLMLTVFLSFVIILLLFVRQSIQFYIQKSSILKSNIILLETMFKKESWIYNSLILNISGLIYSLNL